MYVIVVLIDRLNRRALSANGQGDIAPPNLDALAWRTARFEIDFAGSLSCMLARRDIITGEGAHVTPVGHRWSRSPSACHVSWGGTAAGGQVTDPYHFWEEAGERQVQPA